MGVASLWREMCQLLLITRKHYKMSKLPLNTKYDVQRCKNPKIQSPSPRKWCANKNVGPKRLIDISTSWGYKFWMPTPFRTFLGPLQSILCVFSLWQMPKKQGKCPKKEPEVWGLKYYNITNKMWNVESM